MTGGAHEELARLGQLGDLGLELLRRVGRQVARTQGFPPPDGHTAWTDEAVDELLFEMISRKDEKFLLNCFLKTVDDTSLEKMFYTSIRNFLIDEAKSTERGKLRRRIAKRLREDDLFRAAPATSPRWALASHPAGAIWQGELDELIRAAWEVRGVWITAWNTSGPTPRQTVHALMGVLIGVLEAAGGAVREEDLAKVLEARFELLAPAEFTALYADDGALIDSVTGQTQDDIPEAETVAREIWGEMSPQERLLLPLLEDDPAEVSVLLGLKRHQTSAIMDSLSAKLAVAITAGGSSPGDVATALLRRSGDPP
ncbi:MULTISPECIES: ribosome-binding factor A [Streptomyces]|uniref:RNA polymerase sigma factor 70 region 4 type 2 domain-containing protein n=1 Tax=Streptomyces cellulosae TaxID=1968 RepID=A0ABW7YI94_STRCE